MRPGCINANVDISPSEVNHQCHCHLSWNQEVGFVSPNPSPKVAGEFSHVGLQHNFFFYQRDDGLKLMSL